MSTRASRGRERDFFDDSPEEEEVQPAAEPGVFGFVGKQEEDDDLDGTPVEPAPTLPPATASEDMSDRMANMESTSKLGGDDADLHLGRKLSKREQMKAEKMAKKQFKREGKAKQMEQLAANTPAFSKRETFDMEEFENPTAHGAEQSDHAVNPEKHRQKMLDLKSMGNTAAMVARIQDAPEIKHTFTEQHRKIVMAYAASLIILAFYGLWVGVEVLGCGEHTSIATMYILVCVFMLMAAPVGLYGAARVTSDVEKEIGSMEVVDKAKENLDEDGEAPDEAVATGEEDDGIGTLGQDLIAGFFVASMFGTILWLILAVEAFALADRALMHACNHQDTLMYTLGWLGIVSTMLLVGGSYFVGKVVSGFYLAKTVAQLLHIALMAFGAMMFVGCMTLVNQVICLVDGQKGTDANGEETTGLEESTPSLVMFGLVGLSGYSLTMVSAMGHIAASRLSRSLLQRHVKVLTIWMVISGIFGFSAMVSGVDMFVSLHCLELLNGLPMEWFATELQCPKYVGQGETWNGTGWDSSTQGPAEIPSCAKGFNRFAWEVNPVQRVGGGEVNHYGCINTLCCHRMNARVRGWEGSIFLLLFMIFMFAFSTIWMDYRLMAQASRAGNVGLKRKESSILWGVRGFLALMAIIMPVIVFDSDCSAVTSHVVDAGNFMPDLDYVPATPAMPPSCYNTILDGMETDVDCGGSCSKRCVLDEACGTEEDCASSMECVPTAAFNEPDACFDLRCLPGQMTRATGLCAFPGPETTCYDGEMGQRETCVDGGGPGCRDQGLRCASNCVVDDDCVLGTRCENYDCVSCTGGTKDGGETDIDCGGPTCTRCEDGLRCLTNLDCRSEQCHTSTGRCVSFTNGVKDGTESGVDCGGQAPRRCQLEAECSIDTDCQSGNCVWNSQLQMLRCTEPDAAAQCWSGSLDGLETCIDGGGPICLAFGRACDIGDGCGETADCRTGHCYQDICASCSNGIIDGDESDIDCGVICGACSDGEVCSSDDQCLHNSYCYFSNAGATGMCASAYNNRRDADEACSDGGGQAAVLYARVCSIQANCNQDYDCVTGNCGDNSRCIVDDVMSACLDGSHNGWETDLDCGGRSCRSVGQLCHNVMAQTCTGDIDCIAACHGRPCACQNGRCGQPQICTVDTDCGSATCYGGHCRSCSNNLYDGHETDVDCGGECGGCGDGRVCHVSSDCISGRCEISITSGVPWPVCVSCYNGILDGDEVDIDCGGGCDRLCPIGGFCTAPIDCSTGACNSTHCTADVSIPSPVSCFNNQRDHAEADTDCGGECAAVLPLCGAGSICTTDADCDSYQCDSLHRCSSCSDSLLNGDETDIDCGGPVCHSCADTQRCDFDSDCSSQNCAGPAGGHTVCSSCRNGVQDGTESDIDCGTDCPLQCADTSRCYADSDCMSMHCGGDGLCSRVDPATACSDGFLGEHETCIDGGGPQCTALGMHCALDESCFGDDDCVSGYCYNQMCVSCTDAVLNGDETDLDCGGLRCPQCTDTQNCMLPSDCTHTACWFRNTASFNGVCFSTENGIQDGDETCPDGGGPTATNGCPNDESCVTASDCISYRCVSSCVNTGGFSSDDAACRAEAVMDDAVACGAVTGATGGPVCTFETYNQGSNKVCAPQRPEITCVNDAKGELETDVDCGGDICRSRGNGTCALWQNCVVNEDCDIGATCTSNGGGLPICSEMGCINNARTGDESDVDCGGNCDSCLPGQLCNTDADCMSTDLCFNVSAIGTGNYTACARMLPIVFTSVHCGDLTPGGQGTVCPANPALGCDELCATDQSCPSGCGLLPALTSFEIVSGEILMHTLFVESSEPYGLEGHALTCVITVNLVTTGGLTISFPGQLHTDLGFDDACRAATTITLSAHNDATLTGPVNCVAVLLDAYQLDTACSSPWSDGTNPTDHLDDTVDAVVTVAVLQTNAYCAMPNVAHTQLAVRVVGRPQLSHRGSVTKSSSSFDGHRDSFGIDGVTLTGRDAVCAEYVGSLTNCEWGCCDVFPAMVTAVGMPLSCTQLFSFGWTCAVEGTLGGHTVAMGTLCPDSCGTCEDPPQPGDVNTASLQSPRAGLFALDVPFTATSHALNGNVGTMVVAVAASHASGFVATTVTTPFYDGVVQLGAIPLAGAGTRQGPVTGRCVSPSAWGAAASMVGPASAVARLRLGHLQYPAEVDVLAEVHVDLTNGGEFLFADQAAGTYTVECIDDVSAALPHRRGPERLVTVERALPAPEQPQVILMPGSAATSPSAITVVISWDEYGDAAQTAIDAHATCASLYSLTL